MKQPKDLKAKEELKIRNKQIDPSRDSCTGVAESPANDVENVGHKEPSKQ